MLDLKPCKCSDVCEKYNVLPLWVLRKNSPSCGFHLNISRMNKQSFENVSLLKDMRLRDGPSKY